jgi:hypothetical protein
MSNKPVWKCNNCGLIFEITVKTGSQVQVKYGLSHCPTCGGDGSLQIQPKKEKKTK